MSPFITLPGNNAVHGAIVPIGRYVFTGSTNSATFTNIPQGYQDLRAVINVCNGGSIVWQANGDNGSNYTYTTLEQFNGANVSTRGSYSAGIIGGRGAYISSVYFSTLTLDILNYANTSNYKVGISRYAGDQVGVGVIEFNASVWKNATLTTAAITSLSIYLYMELDR